MACRPISRVGWATAVSFGLKLAARPAKLKGLSERLIRSHQENNYDGSIKALNDVEKQFDAMTQAFGLGTLLPIVCPSPSA
jgi:hypothetical protein